MNASRDISEWTDEFFERADLIRKKIMLDIMSRVIMRTPVDTGRARGNWHITRNRQPTEQLNGVDKGVVNDRGQGASKRVSVAERVINNSNINETVYLTNNLPYIQRLEEGYSENQAPAGMVGITIRQYRDTAEAALRSIGLNGAFEIREALA